MDRLRAHIIEAAEQCERTALSELAEPRKLDSLLADWPTERTLLFADEQGGTPLAKAAEAGPGAILIGPEGGFTDRSEEHTSELQSLMRISYAVFCLKKKNTHIHTNEHRTYTSQKHS